MALAQRAGLADLAEAHVRPGGPCGVNAQMKIPGLVAGMAVGADSIDDMDLLRHGALPGLLGGIRAPSTLGSHLRSFTWGNVLQLEMVSRPGCSAAPTPGWPLAVSPARSAGSCRACGPAR
jgi:hypothetical protein